MSESSTDARIIPVCPECDHPDITPRNADHECSTAPDGAKDWRCTRGEDCGARFDEPRYREAKAASTPAGDTLAATLDEMTVAEFDAQVEVGR